MTEHDTHSPLDALLGAAPRRVFRHWLSLLVLALAALGALAFFVRFVSGDDSPYYSAPIERGNLTPLISERGQIRGAGEVTVFSALPGRVSWVSGKSDGEVKQGELLAVIDAGEVEGAVEVGQSRLTSAQAALDAAQVDAMDTASRLARFEGVWRRSGGRAPSLNEIERARAEARKATLAVEAAKAEATAAQVQLKEDEGRKAGAEVRAPFSGLMTMRHAQPGQMIGDHQPLFTIAQGIQPLTVEVPLDTRRAEPIKAGTLANIRLDAVPDALQSATLTLLRVSPPPQSAPPLAVFTIEKPGPQVRPGMKATVEIELPERQNVLLVPNAALEFEPGARGPHRRERIFVLDGGEPRRVYVTVGASDGKRTEVFANGLKPGDHAIIGWRDATAGGGK
ncbi:efflux RND transporter periplasmic adaptor subunit [Novosphingobium guangzhouense]|uniref:Efflux transporter periplasmic adaptor subunit n=1 Tax=Novosphingobium guangzhouense TaxID=1850347 RepID=A0A2K2FV89_9SPHN|nr:efflux RND transporter periplasmic adaptor subunit [Novosphingobium guangzhouense]PNU02696.1 efflux transporter periplasmic adaptor subunit [Novosphingobium guangzhouense]